MYERINRTQYLAMIIGNHSTERFIFILLSIDLSTVWILSWPMIANMKTLHRLIGCFRVVDSLHNVQSEETQFKIEECAAWKHTTAIPRSDNSGSLHLQAMTTCSLSKGRKDHGVAPSCSHWPARCPAKAEAKINSSIWRRAPIHLICPYILRSMFHYTSHQACSS